MYFSLLPPDGPLPVRGLDDFGTRVSCPEDAITRAARFNVLISN